jgi:hypothetical protein
MGSIAVRYEVANLAQTLSKAQTAGGKVLVQPYEVESCGAAMVQRCDAHITAKSRAGARDPTAIRLRQRHAHA